VIPVPVDAFEVMRQALVRNQRGWRAFFAVDPDGDLLLRGRVAAETVTLLELDRVLGEIYETVELSFRPLVNAIAASRENSG